MNYNYWEHPINIIKMIHSHLQYWTGPPSPTWVEYEGLEAKEGINIGSRKGWGTKDPPASNDMAVIMWGGGW